MPTKSATNSLPNVIFILTDDQGPWAAGCYGNDEIRTPNIDRLADTGVRFSKFFVACPVCSPSRATYLTGRINSQHGIHDWIPRDENSRDWIGSEVAYTDVMVRHGYTCGISGKWHMGDALHPQHGFDFWYTHQFGGGPYHGAPMVRNGELIEEPGYITDVITDEALGYIDRHHQDDNPFYLSVHYTAPHSPWEGHPQDIVDSYDDCPFASCPQEEKHPWAISLTDTCLGNREMLKGYFAAVTAMDNNVGRIIDRVEQLGLREDTLIVFCSDNGFSCGQHGLWGKGNGTAPRNMYENSITVPFVVSQPGRLPQSHVSEGMMSAYDFMPTLLDYLGMGDDVPYDEQNLPGTSFVPSWLGDDSASPEIVVVYDEYGPVRMIRTQQHKYVERYPDGPNELYDLGNDPDERENRIDDPAIAATVSELKAAMEDWFAKYVTEEHDGLKQTHTAEGRPVGVHPRDLEA